MANLRNPGVDLGTFQLYHRDAGSDEGPLLELRRIGGSQADSDSLGVIRFYGEDDGNAAHLYASIRARARDVTGATEDGALDLRVSVGGTETTMVAIDETGISFQGQPLTAHLGTVVTGVSGTLTTTAHSGNILATSGNVTVPTTPGFRCTLIFGGAHTISFNSTTSAAMAAGDVVKLEVQSATVIKAIKTAAADLVAFS